MLEEQELVRYQPLFTPFHQSLLELKRAAVLDATQFTDFAAMH
jgi:hypothetical protein